MSAQVGQGKRDSKREIRRTLSKLSEARAALSWGILLVIAAVLGAIYLGQTSQIAGVGRHVQDLQFELDEIKRVNAELEREIAEAQSLDRLRAEAIRLGFVRARPENIEYLVVKNVPPQSTPAPQFQSKPSPEPAESAVEALLLAFKSRVGDLTRGRSDDR